MTSHLQRIQSNAARVILLLPMTSNITTHSKSLHWLPVKVRSTYKIACLCYHCHSSTAPSYVADMLHRKPLHTRNTRSSSYTMPLLNRPAHSKATLGDRSFSFASSSVRNSIPNDVRCAPSLSSSKSRLKTYLFRSVYKDFLSLYPTDYTRSYCHPGVQFWVGWSRNWSVFLERPNTGCHEKAPVRCPCSRLAALHGAPRTYFQWSTKDTTLLNLIISRKLRVARFTRSL